MEEEYERGEQFEECNSELLRKRVKLIRENTVPIEKMSDSFIKAFDGQIGDGVF